MKKSTTREKIASQKNLNHSSRRESRTVSTKAGQLQLPERDCLCDKGRKSG
jgi:hypothetical protein